VGSGSIHIQLIRHAIIHARKLARTYARKENTIVNTAAKNE